MDETRSFGELLRDHRHTARMTIEELSDASGVSVRAIGDMERGRSRGPQRRTVAALAAALGLTPSESEALNGAAKAGRPRSVTSPGGGCELPRAVGDFAGRGAELDRLEKLAEEAAGDGRAVAATISGGPGLGKTTLVVRAAESMAGRFPDGRFFLDLRGMDDSPLSPGSALSALLKAFGVADERIPQDEGERAAYYRSVLGRRRSLVVLDNAAGESQVRPLLPGDGNSLVLITSRRSLAGLEDVRQLPLTEMPPEDAVEMLRTIVRADRAFDIDDLDAVAGLCGHLPLAIRIAGNRLLSRPGWTAAQMAGRLADEERRLETLSAGDLHIAAAFAVSYHHLPARARRLFRQLALVPGPDFGAAMTAVLAAMRLDEAEDALEELVELGLLQSPHVGRYRLHDLVKLFARARLAEEETEADRRAAEARMNEWLLDVATAAGRWFGPDHGEPPRDFDGVPLGNPEDAHAWLEVEGANWLAALRSAADHAGHTRVIEVAEAMHWFSDRLAHWTEWREVYEMSSRAARAMGDRGVEAVHVNYLAWALSRCEGRHEDSVECALRAYELARAEEDLGQQAWALEYAGIASWRLPEYERAATYLRQAIDLFRAAGDWDGYPQAAAGYGDCLRGLGRLEDALRQHVSLLEEIKAPDYPGSSYVRDITIAVTLSRIGEDHAALGDWREAADHFRESIPLLRKCVPFLVGDRSHRSQQLGMALQELGDIAGARKAFENALEDYLTIGDERAEDVRKLIAALDG
ncbi:ATP-binding protein [Actinoallomurus sp. CA-142502]|uniref:ATP-binding protein n=1 Tax=Actinoallomurus sp. CA-142502 TaxID=3239885 RepID=UPI003D8D0D12